MRNYEAFEMPNLAQELLETAPFSDEKDNTKDVVRWLNAIIRDAGEVREEPNPSGVDADQIYKLTPTELELWQAAKEKENALTFEQRHENDRRPLDMQLDWAFRKIYKMDLRLQTTVIDGFYCYDTSQVRAKIATKVGDL